MEGGGSSSKVINIREVQTKEMFVRFKTKWWEVGVCKKIINSASVYDPTIQRFTTACTSVYIYKKRRKSSHYTDDVNIVN